ncbi:MAG: 4Fe-4S binding protein [Pirellulaceae bacterium]|nr:4Fe-4S binding protein [Planctomycetales bacterium]
MSSVPTDYPIASNREQQLQERRKFLQNGLRISGVLAAGTFGGFLAGRRGKAEATRWQIDPDKCVGCNNCATQCVLAESAVKCLQCFDMCGYCDVCTGYFSMNYLSLDTAAESQMCPTGAIARQFIEEKAGQRFFEYTIDESLCIGCGKCVKGCALMNGSLYLQVMHDRCVNCNECAIAVSCPTQAFDRLPANRPYRVKQSVYPLIQQKAAIPERDDARQLLREVSPP